ncbi:MAG: transglycosylase domain-containing protein [Fluviicola sp.]|nr:transglycosylase domain-containing protein [Fluviicola sp.]
MAKKEQEKAPKKEFSKKTARVLTVLFWLGAMSPFLLVLFLVYSQAEDELPSVETLENPPELLASIVFADDAKTELGRYWSVNRTNVAYKDISPYVFDALIATEDERFLDHSGIDFRGVGRAIARMGEGGGASTISQQLAKLIFTLEERARIAELKAQGKPVPNQRKGKMKRLDEKVKENIIAVRLEERYTKEEIITMYLNQFDFLYNAVGIENAANVYFNKKPIELNRQEAATLIGMCKNPDLYNPYHAQLKNYRNVVARRKKIARENVTPLQMTEERAKDSTRAIKRRNQVLFQWKRSTNSNNIALKNQMTQKEYDSLRMLPIIIDYQVVDHKEGLAPYFRESLRSDLKALFKSKNEKGELIYKKENGDAYNVYKDGLKIYTTINVDMQQHAEYALKRHLKEDLQPQFDKNNRKLKRYPFTNSISAKVAESLMNSGRKNSDRYRSMKASGISEKEIIASFDEPVPMHVFSWNGNIDTTLTPNDSIRYYKGILRAGMMSIEPSTGFVKAWVGGIDFNHFAFDHVKQGKRQVGSTIKPFVYGTALSMRVVKPCTEFGPDSYFCVDTPGEPGQVGKSWCPRGKKPKGPKTVENGLATSDNLITVAVMSKMGGLSGPKNISKILKGMEINLRPEDEVPAMCLGIMDLSVYQMVAAQAMFVNQGIYNRPTTILRIEDRNGNVIYNADLHSKEVFNPNDAYRTLQIMKGVVQYGTGASLRGTWRKWGGITQPMAGKTGTTQNNSDGWFMGLTPDLVTGIWVGAEDRAVRFRSMEWGQGARMALPIYGYYMQKVYKDNKIKISTEDFDVPIGYDPSIYECEGEENVSDENQINY